MSDDLAELTDLWPPNSPDLNPTDYKIWNIIQQRVYQTKVQDVNDLMQCLIDVWAGKIGINAMLQTLVMHRINANFC